MKKTRHQWIEDRYFKIDNIKTNYLIASYDGKRLKWLAPLMILIFGASGYSIWAVMHGLITGIPAKLWAVIIYLPIAIFVFVLSLIGIVFTTNEYTCKARLIYNGKYLRLVGIRKRKIVRVRAHQSQLLCLSVGREYMDSKTGYRFFILLCIAQNPKPIEIPLHRSRDKEKWEKDINKLKWCLKVPVKHVADR